MSTPLITLIKNRIEIVLNTVPDIEKVYMYPITPINSDTAPFPFIAAFYTFDGWEYRNQLEMNVINLHIETWIRVGANTDTLITKLELFEANIHKVIFDELESGTLHRYTQKVEKRQPQYQYIDEDSTGILTQEYLLTYGHNKGNSLI
jgi:hypothetical protein